MTYMADMFRLQHRFNALESLACDRMMLYDDKKKGFKPKYKWKDREAHFEYKRKRKEIFKMVNLTQKRLTDELCKPDIFNSLHGIYKDSDKEIPDSRFGDRIPPDGEVLLKGKKPVRPTRGKE